MVDVSFIILISYSVLPKESHPYLFEKFFEQIATEHFLGEGIQPEHFNDERLGRVLDKLYDAGLTEIFIRVPLSAADRF